MFRRIYLDNAATTPIDERVVREMMPFFTEKFGNASSVHFFGQQARAAVDGARHNVAALIGAAPGEIVFTSGGTEANNLAVRGLVEANRRHGNHIITSAVEHPSVLAVFENLSLSGFEMTTLPVSGEGRIRIGDVRAAVREDTILISIMTANNEIGAIQPVAEIGDLVSELRDSGQKIWFHTDAVQAAGKIPTDVRTIGCDLFTISGHKIYAPKGIGALFVKRGVRISSQNLGGHQERERRGGTENVALIAGFGKACEFALDEREESSERLMRLRTLFENGVLGKIPDVLINGAREDRLPNISNISFRGVEGEGLLINLDMAGVAVSTGSACSSGSLEPSPVIIALGANDEMARGAVRFSFGRSNTVEEVERALEVLPEAVETLRKLSPRFQPASGA